MRHGRTTVRGALGALLLAAAVTGGAQEEILEAIEEQGLARSGERREAQEQIDRLNEANRALLDQYRAELKIVEGLETYVGMLGRQLDSQAEEIATLQTSIGDVAVIQRQVQPLLARMIDSLDSFIALDMPFLAAEREDRVTRLRALLGRSDVTVAEKTRRVFEAYQIESEFGRTIEAYKAKLDLDSGPADADVLRIGRVGLMYRTAGNGRLGYWHQASKSWRPLPASPYRRLIETGLQVARQEIAPELVVIPMNPAEVNTP